MLRTVCSVGLIVSFCNNYEGFIGGDTYYNCRINMWNM